MNLATSCALVSYSSSITGLRSTALPIACSICFDTSLSPFPCWFQWLPPPIAILQDLMSDPSHSFSLSTSLLILHTLPDDVQPTDFLLLLDTELKGRYHTTPVPFSITVIFFPSPIYLEYMRAVRVKVPSNLATGGFKVLWFQSKNKIES